jgi:hypothetical protein
MNLHRALKRFKGQILTEQDVSILFLEQILESGDQRYHTIATVLLQELHKLDTEELQLLNLPIPTRLRLDGMVETLAMTQNGTSLILGEMERTRPRQRIHRAAATITQECVDTPTLETGVTSLPTINPIQGTQYHVNKMHIDRRQQNKRREWPYPQPERSARRQKNRQQKFHGTCDACGRYGHTAAQCDYLAMKIYMKKYMRDITPDMLKTVEENWTTRNEQWLGKDAKAP